MSRTAQNILYLVIILAVTAILFFLAPRYVHNTHGVYLPTIQQQYPSINVNAVQLYTIMPTDAKVVGIIRTLHHYNTTDKSTMQRLQENAIRYAQLQAAKHGANGVVITQLGRTIQGGPLDGVILYAKAIRT